MEKTKTLTITAGVDELMTEAMARVENQINEGFTSGVNPTWSLVGATEYCGVCNRVLPHAEDEGCEENN